MLYIKKTPEPFHEAPWRPAADIYNCHDGWLVKFDLAGVRPEDVQISVNGRQLVVSGLRRDWMMESGSRFYSMEISYNCFRRAVELPCELNQARVATEYRDGMLLVRLCTGRNAR